MKDQNKFWTKERVSKLIQLIENKVSASEAAIQLGTSKNAVIGKAYRLNMVFNSNDNLELEEKSVRINFDNVFPHKGCLWIKDEGDPIPLREDMFCGQPVAVEGSSWCTEHIKRVYLKKAAA